MSEQSKSALTTLNNNNVVNQTAPESITPGILGSNVLQNIIDSMWNKVDDLLTLPPTTITKAQLATAIGASSLNNRTNGYSDKQWLQITDRTDTYPLFVQINGANTISPFGIWVKAGKPLAVIMDYVNNYQGETLPFIAVFDENRNLYVQTPVIIKDGTEFAGATLVSDANGKSSWSIGSSAQSGVLNSGLLAGGGSLLMAGFGLPITPNSKKMGRVLISISGEFVSDDATTDTNFSVRVGTGAVPASGDPVTGTALQTIQRRASDAVKRIPLDLNIIAMLTPGTLYWIDVAASNNGAGNVEFFNVSISAIEQ